MTTPEGYASVVMYDVAVLLTIIQLLHCCGPTSRSTTSARTTKSNVKGGFTAANFIIFILGLDECDVKT